ncbi:putative tetraacyldisaccharide 4'-kinase, mitochondrial [Dendrobium catenatum]|uniref:Putative tetraacyldisaccharide 4'-kinase, mitochondrial n=1 Tax=Dendrobium catenatum TaxID=906689 RepID=A0A2I0VC18_9ASPA|nr:putative tetraacyldisaccharide 4'-kinase, mitochondrial [Dendrobium catenatum]
MLQRHLSKTSVKIGVGANRSAAAAEMFERYGCMELGSALHSEAPLSPFKSGPHLRTEMIGIVILDDGMQVLHFVYQCLHAYVFMLTF